jgi:hypothetical protein
MNLIRIASTLAVGYTMVVCIHGALSQVVSVLTTALGVVA